MPSCGYVDNSPLRSELPTYPQLLRLGPRSKGDISTLLKRGHFYFGLTANPLSVQAKVVREREPQVG